MTDDHHHSYIRMLHYRKCTTCGHTTTIKDYDPTCDDCALEGHTCGNCRARTGHSGDHHCPKAYGR